LSAKLKSLSEFGRKKVGNILEDAIVINPNDNVSKMANLLKKGNMRDIS